VDDGGVVVVVECFVGCLFYVGESGEWCLFFVVQYRVVGCYDLVGCCGV